LRAGLTTKAATLRKLLGDLKYSRNAPVPSIAGGGGGWSNCPVRKCCIAKGLDFCFECPEFPCERIWGEKSEHANVFTADKTKRLQEMKEIGVEEWIKKQWK
jgi:hypothetical protein